MQGAAELKEAAATQALADAREERAAAAESMRRVHDTFISVSGGSARGAGRAKTPNVPNPDHDVGAGDSGASRGSRPNGAQRGREGSGAGSDALAASGVRSNGKSGRRLSLADALGVPLAATQVPGMSGGVHAASPSPAPGGASEPAADSYPMVHPTLVEQPLASASGLGSRRAVPSAGAPENPAHGASQAERPATDSAPDGMPDQTGQAPIENGQGGGEVPPEDGNQAKANPEPRERAADADSAMDGAEEREEEAGAAAARLEPQGAGSGQALDAHTGALVRAPELSAVSAPARRLSFGTPRAPCSCSAADGGEGQNPDVDPSPDPYALDNRDSGAQRSGDENAAHDPNSMAESGGGPHPNPSGADFAGEAAEPARMEVDDTEGPAGGSAPQGLGKVLPRGLLQGAQPGTLDDEGGELAGMS